jgi:hypothetical protein
MGNKSSSPQNPNLGTKTLKDTTLRSVVFGLKDISVIPNESGHMVLENQVDQTTFDQYEHVLKIMAQISRIVYCDTGVQYKCLQIPELGSNDNKTVNSKITEITKEYGPMKKQPSNLPNSKQGRPMVSYTVPQSTGGNTIAKYISSPSDLAILFLKGSHLSSKIPGVKDTDLVIAFKGSSTMKNFKHDLYSQFTATDLSSIMPEGLTASSGEVGNVPASFIKPLNKSWKLITETINEFNPNRLFVTGHSLGGAYASLFSFILCEAKSSFANIQSIHLVTFGCPTIVADKARNTFNSHLDSGFLTLDRVVSSGITSKIEDIIPKIPAGFSHPGFQPLKTEFYPEKKTGRAYNIDTIRKVYQKGGFLGFGSEKNKYEISTKIHMPNKIVVGAYTLAGNTFAHSEYFDILFEGAFRTYGMKNSGFAGNTFVANISDTGIIFNYVSSDPTEEVALDAQQDDSSEIPKPPSRGKTYRNRRKNKRTIRKSIRQ